MASKNETFSFVIPPWLKKKIREGANNKGVPMSEFVKDILKVYFEGKE